MNNRSTIGASAVALLAIAYVGGSWALGRAIHSRFDTWEQELARQPLPLIKIAGRKYTPGVFSSVEEVTFEFNRELFDALMKSRQQAQPESDEAEQPADVEQTPTEPPARFTLLNEVKHGPLPGFTGVGIGRIDTRIVWSRQARAQLDQFLPGREPIEIVTRLGLLGGASSHVTSPAFDFKDEKARFAWQGFEGDFSVGRNMGSFDCNATAPGLSVYDAEGAGAKLETLKLTCDGERVFDALFAGTVNFELAKIEGSAKGGTSPFRAEKVSYLTDVRAKGDYMDMAVKVDVGALNFMQYELSDLKYHVSLRHLHGPTYAAFSSKLQSSAMSSMGGDPAASLALAGAFGEFGPLLLEHSPQIVIDDIGFSAPEGAFGIKGTVALADFKKDDLATPQSQAALVRKVVANADVRVSEGLLNKDWSAPGAKMDVSATQDAQSPSRAEMLRQQVAAFEQQGFVTRKDGQILSHIEFKRGALTANGKPLR